MLCWTDFADFKEKRARQVIAGCLIFILVEFFATARSFTYRAVGFFFLNENLESSRETLQFSANVKRPLFNVIKCFSNTLRNEFNLLLESIGD